MITKVYTLKWYNKPVFWFLKKIGIIQVAKPKEEERTVCLKYRRND